MSSASRSASSPASGSWSRTPSSGGARGRGRWPGRRARRCSLDSASRACSAAVRRVSANPSRASSAASAASSPGCGSTASISSRPNRSRSASRARSRALATTSSSSRSTATQARRAGRRTSASSAAVCSPPNRSSASRWARAAAAGAGRTGRARRPAARPRSASAETGTEAPPTNARERPSAETLRASRRGRPRPRRRPPRPRRRTRPGRRPATTPSTRARLRAGAHGAAVGAAAEQQAERGDDHGLAGAGLTGDHGQARAELEGRGVDHAERADPDLLKHRGPRPAVGGARSAPRQPSTGRPNLATSRSVNGASCSRTSRTGRAPRRTSIRAPGGRSTVRRPSHHSTPAPSVRASTSTASTDVGRRPPAAGRTARGR